MRRRRAFEVSNITLTQGIFLGQDDDVAEAVLDNWHRVSDRDGEIVPQQGLKQSQHELKSLKVEMTE